MRFISFLCCIVILTSCTRIPDKVNHVIKMAGKNGGELQKVVNYYKESGEKQKLEAAYFLIANMEDKFGVYYSDDSYFFKLLPQVDSLKKDGANNDKIDEFIQRQWKLNRHKNNAIEEPKAYRDIHMITADYLIENIDLAFKVWKKPWAKHLNFDEFCEWILPYRVNNEPLQYWRNLLMEEFSWLDDSVKKTENTEEVCLLVNKHIAKDYHFSPKLSFVPQLGGIDAWHNKQGLCEHRYRLITLAMRSVGIPVKIDFTPQFLRSAIGHSWTVLLNQDGKISSFNGGETWAFFRDELSNPIDRYQVAEGTTFYRNNYAVDKNLLRSQLSENDIPPNLAGNNVSEVSHEYTGNDKTNVIFELKNAGNNSHAFLFAFNQSTSFIALTGAGIKDNKVVFKDVGRGSIYIAGYYKNGEIIIDSDPVIVNPGSNTKESIKPNVAEVQNIRLYRKYPPKYSMFPFRDAMQGAKIQGANKRDFSDSTTLHIVEGNINYYKRFDLEIKTKYRYYRYLSADSGDVRIADIALLDEKGENISLLHSRSFYGFISNKNTDDDVVFKHAFDNNVQSNFNAPPNSWVAVDMGKPVLVSAYRIVPRNHLNIVEPGNTYELLLFNKDWYILDTKVAEDYFIDFKGVPIDALLLLRNKTKGKEERIFRYVNGKQVWM